MICKDCRDAADTNRQELHCDIENCACQHKPLADEFGMIPAATE
jgi:hypothetical protein